MTWPGAVWGERFLWSAVGESGRGTTVRGPRPWAFVYKVPFSIMDTAQACPFVVFKQIMIPTFQTV